jgi:transposase
MGGADMSLKNTLVSIPEKKITYKKAANGTVYVYYTLRAYRNKDGKPTSDEVAIGKKDNTTGALVPNNRYFEIFQGTNVGLAPKSVRSCGNTATLMEITKQTGLLNILQICFPNNWNRILACAFYILCEGNVMMYVEDWFDETKVPFTDRMDDVDCSKLFASITADDKTHFFTEWIKFRGEKEYIAYDVSSISTYSRNIDIAEWGYNRDHDSLPQVNLGMYYGVTSHMPVYYDIYSGSIPDKTYLELMMASAKSLGIHDVCFVIDCGFVTEDNFRSMHNAPFSFITAIPGQRLEALRLIDENKRDIRKSINRISEYELYGIQRKIDMYGISLNAYIYFDPEKQAFDEKELYARIEKLQAELERMSHTKRVTKKYKDFFMIDEKLKGNALAFELDTTKVDEKLERAGFFVLLSSKPDLSSSEVLKIYRDRDVIEKSFEQFKNRLDFRRMRTHWNKTTEGKMFVGFLALILRSYMLRVMKDAPQTKHLTFDKVLIELRKIKSVTLSDLSEILIPLTKLQKTILSTLSIAVEKLAT